MNKRSLFQITFITLRLSLLLTSCDLSGLIPKALRKMLDLKLTQNVLGLTQWLSGKESACNEENLGSIPGFGRSPGGGHGNPLQYSSLENPMNRGAWWATGQRVTKSQTPLSD